MRTVEEIGAAAKIAQRKLAAALSDDKNRVLRFMAEEIKTAEADILTANAQDVARAKENGMRDGLIDRLTLTPARIASMILGIEQIADADDPVGKVLWGESRPNGLMMRKVTVPMGVIAVIFEARPNVTTDAAALCLKAGSAVILKGGKEAAASNLALTNAMRSALKKAGLPEDCVSLVEDNSRETTTKLMKLNEYLDLLIPRGGAGLINSVVQNSTVPVIQTGVGNCHVYVDSAADIQMAVNIVVNAKTSRVSVCNACESLLIHKDIAEDALIAIGTALKEKGVEIRGDEVVCEVLPFAKAADDDDWGREYLDYIISAKVVESLEEAAEHIAKYGTGHSECIVTNDYNAARSFTAAVDAAAVYVNASTRFTDGGEFGFGAEIGISTQKLHARGPLGLNDLVTEKYIIMGDGQVR